MNIIKQSREAPSNPQLGDIYFDLNITSYRIFNGETWGSIHQGWSKDMRALEIQTQFNKDLKDILDE